MDTPSSQPPSFWAKLSSIPFPLILAANLILILYLVVELKDYDAKKKELVDKSALLQEAASLRADIAGLQSLKGELEAVRKELTATQAKVVESKEVISKAEAINLSLASLRTEEAALNTRLEDIRKSITGLVESRAKFGESEKAAEARIAKAAAASDELTIVQAKLSKAMGDLQKTQNNIDELAKTKAQLDAVKAELSLKGPELAALRDEVKEQTKAKNAGAAELANLERKKFDLRLLEEARAEHLRLSGERTALNTEIATLTGQKEAIQKEVERIAKSLGTTQGQLRILLTQKADLEAELIALRAAIIKK
jgi:chromosome segregation ATPase